ncbi:hypothetical protein [Candidatus Berkiella aquae]|uniref:Uncharacterized protein n=1 Tax=Candidatus Berkiella aquae TaxID=295108 RepID=A0A0Q9YPD0_9GAMM|nr:hypothetical protein [Candidatus Berkiella aquae]MCS5712015.1 hypothetical protein [Candidatus Berkiella aquae]
MAFLMNIREFFQRLFKSKSTPVEQHLETGKLEPKYWQEVIDFRERLEKVIKENTIDADNISSVNQRVLDFLIEQINTKGSIPTVPERYNALNILVDRMLISYQSKIVGLKKGVTTHTDFTDAVNAFKLRLKEREQKELTENKPR